MQGLVFYRVLGCCRQKLMIDIYIYDYVLFTIVNTKINDMISKQQRYDKQTEKKDVYQAY